MITSNNELQLIAKVISLRYTSFAQVVYRSQNNPASPALFLPYLAVVASYSETKAFTGQDVPLPLCVMAQYLLMDMASDARFRTARQPSQ